MCDLKTKSHRPKPVSKLDILIGTFNLNGKCLDADISDWLINRSPFEPDIIAVSLQEVGGGLAKCTACLEACLAQCPSKYKLLAMSDVAATTVLVLFTTSDMERRIEGVSGKYVPTTLILWSLYGGKGAAAIAFDVDKSISLLFIGCHLCAHEEEVERRNVEYAFILDQLKEEYEKADLVFFCGDLNYRLDVDDDVARMYASTPGCWPTLLKFDQLNREIALRSAFHFMHEPQISFRPTYKFDLGTRTYHTNVKGRRRPAWTDRILYLEKGNFISIRPFLYSSVEDITISDHKPVLAAFQVISTAPQGGPVQNPVAFSRCRVDFDNVEFGKVYVASIVLENRSSDSIVPVTICRHSHIADECLRVDPSECVDLQPCRTDLSSSISIRFIFEMTPSSMAFLHRTRVYNEQIRIRTGAFNTDVTVQAKCSPALQHGNDVMNMEWLVGNHGLIDCVSTHLTRGNNPVDIRIQPPSRCSLAYATNCVVTSFTCCGTTELTQCAIAKFMSTAILTNGGWSGLADELDHQCPRYIQLIFCSVNAFLKARDTLFVLYSDCLSYFGCAVATSSDCRPASLNCLE